MPHWGRRVAAETRTAASPTAKSSVATPNAPVIVMSQALAVTPVRARRKGIVARSARRLVVETPTAPRIGAKLHHNLI